MIVQDVYMKKIIIRRIDGILLLCLIAIFAILLTGGYKGDLLGFSISATTPSGAIKFALLLLLIRFVLTVKLADFLLMAVSIGIALFFAELVLRIWDAPITKHQLVQIHRASPTSGWELIPGARGVGNTGAVYEINSKGCRDHEYPPRQSYEGKRIVVLGDSFTFGMGVNLKDTFPKQLEQMLRRRGHQAEIINCGVIGHDMWHHLRTLDTRAWGYEPDLIILSIYYNDFQASLPPAEARQPGFQGKNPFEKPGGTSWRHRSALYNVVRNTEDLLKYRFRASFGANHIKGLAERKKFVGPDNPNNNHYRIMAGKTDPKLYSDFKKSLAKFAVAVHSRGVDLLVILIPDAVQLNDPHMQVVNKVVTEASDAAEVPFLDLTMLLQQNNNPESLYLFPDDAHNSPLGLASIAQGVADKLLASDLLRSTRQKP